MTALAGPAKQVYIVTLNAVRASVCLPHVCGKRVAFASCSLHEA